MNIQLVETENFPVVSMAGEINPEDAEVLEKMVDSVVLRGGHIKIIFDLSETSFVASNIFGVLLAVASQLSQKGGKVAIVGTSERTREILHLLSMEQYFVLFETRADALVAMK